MSQKISIAVLGGVKKMKYLLEIAAAVGAKKRDEEVSKTARDRKGEIKREMEKLSEKNVDEILCRIFPGGIPTDSRFYDSLQDFQHQVGQGPAFYALGGRLWAKVYNGLSQEKQKPFLDLLFDDKGGGVWRAIFYLPEFCKEVEIEPEFAAGWFYRFGDKVKGDMANWDFFNGVRNYAFHFPGSGLKVFETYMGEQLDELKMILGALLLGTIRSRTAEGHFQKIVVERWDKRLRTSSQIQTRLVYHRSLPTSFDLGTLTTQALNRKLTTMLKGEPDEVSEAFQTVWRCLRAKRADRVFVQFAMKWFSKHASDKLPDAAKHHVVDAMWYFCTPGKKKTDIRVSEADDLLIAVQPIPAANRGTWEYLEMYLVERLRQDRLSFEDVLTRLVDANPEGILAQFQSDVFDHLKSELCKAQVQDFMTKWLLSTDKNKRKIARAIFKKAESITFSPNIISEASETQLEVALQEFIRRPPLAEKTSAYLLALEPAFRTSSPALKQKFKKEMVLQAINYPGACLNSWKKMENPSDLLQEVIKDAESYFEKLRATKDSPAIAFGFPGCKEAAEKERSEFSRKVSSEAREKSVFAKFAKNVQIIYGSEWAVMMQGKLGKPSGFHEIGHSMEFARLEGIDPEGMAMKRIRAESKIRRQRVSNGGN